MLLITRIGAGQQLCMIRHGRSQLVPADTALYQSLLISDRRCDRSTDRSITKPSRAKARGVDFIESQRRNHHSLGTLLDTFSEQPIGRIRAAWC